MSDYEGRHLTAAERLTRISFSDSQVRATTEIIAYIRRKAGRMTLAEICDGIGVNPGDAYNRQKIRQLCHRHNLLYRRVMGPEPKQKAEPAETDMMVFTGGKAVPRREAIALVKALGPGITIAGACEKIGVDPTDRHNFHTVVNLCRQYRLEYTKAPRPTKFLGTVTVEGYEPACLRAAQAQARKRLKAEIAAAIAERPTAPPLDGGRKLEW